MMSVGDCVVQSYVARSASAKIPAGMYSLGDSSSSISSAPLPARPSQYPDMNTDNLTTYSDVNRRVA